VDRGAPGDRDQHYAHGKHAVNDGKPGRRVSHSDPGRHAVAGVPQPDANADRDPNDDARERITRPVTATSA